MYFFQEELVRLESKLESLENSLVKNRKTFEKIRETVDELRREQAVIKTESKAVRAKGRSTVNKTFASVSKADLVFASLPVSQCDIQVECIHLLMNLVLTVVPSTRGLKKIIYSRWTRSMIP